MVHSSKKVLCSGASTRSRRCWLCTEGQCQGAQTPRAGAEPPALKTINGMVTTEGWASHTPTGSKHG